MEIESREDVVMKKLCEYYLDQKHLDIINNILQKDSKLTLRVLEWFITIYSREKENNTQHIYNNFKLNLKSYSKKLFDPFCRGNRIVLAIGPDNYLETTVGQLNFFRFVIDYKILDEYEKHKEFVDKAMVLHGFKKKIKN